MRLFCSKICFLLFGLLVCAPAAWAGAAAKVTPKVRPFALSDVQLLNGPFKQAMELDEKYLLSLEPDRLLSWFRKEAGLKPKAPVYGGWESSGLAGHTLGHYLSACSHMYQSTGDKQFLDRVKYIVSQLAECQQANGNGYVAAIPKGKELFAEVARGEIKSGAFNLNGGWSPWYTIHKELAGLIDSYTLCGDTQALVVATNLANWVGATTTNLTHAQWQDMLKCEYGGMNEALANLYGLTGNPLYLDLARKFYDDSVLNPLAKQKDDLTGKHSNTQIPKIIGLARLYELTGNQRDEDIAKFFWDRVAEDRSYVIGGDGDHEHFFPTNDFAKHLSASAAETCCTYNMLKLTRHLFEWAPDAKEMDFYERALYNDILASQDPKRGMFVYLMSLKPGHFKTFSTPENSFWCCVGTGMENHAKYGGTIYFHNEHSLYLNLFIASQLTWPEKHLVVRQDTQFPESDTTRLTFKCDQPVSLALKIRWPKWAKTLVVSVNGQRQKISGHPESYVTVDREWHNGDRVNIQLPMTLHMHPVPDTTNIFSVLYGPIVLAGELGTNDIPDQYADDQTAYVHLPDPTVPVFVGQKQSLLKHIKPTGKPLTFRTHHLGKPYDVTLLPFYQVNYQRYSIYWTVLTESQWKTRKAELAAAEARRIALEKRTIDSVQPGEHQSEYDHKVQGENSAAVEALGRKLRHAYDGGWFSYQMKVDPNATNELVCTWWGDESGKRNFDILVNGTKIATQQLLHNRPGKFWNATYPIPANLTRGKTHVVVKFQAHPGNFAGGLFGLRVLKAETDSK